MAALTILQNLRAQNDRREAEMRRLQEQMQQRAQQAAVQGQDMIRAGGKLKNVLSIVGSDLDERGRAILEFEADLLKRREKEAQTSQTMGAAASPLIAQLARSGANPNTEQYGQAVSQITQIGQAAGLEQDQISPILQLLGPAAMAQSLAQKEADFQAKAAAEKELALQASKQRQEARIAREQIPLDAAAQRRAKAADLYAEKATALYSNQVADLIASGERVDAQKIATAIKDDPSIGGAEAPAYANLILMEAVTAARMNQPAVDVRESIRARTGIPVSMNVAKLVADGKAMEEPFSGIPMMAATSGERIKIASGGAALAALADVFVAAQKVIQNPGATSPGVLGINTQELQLSPFMRGIGMGPTDDAVQAYDAARTIVGGLISKTLTGTQNAEKETARYMNLLPTVAELQRDPRTGGLSKTSIARLEQAYRTTLGFVAGASLVDDKRTRDAFRKAFDARVISLNPPEPPTLLRRPGAAPLPVRGGQDPRFPVIR